MKAVQIEVSGNLDSLKAVSEFLRHSMDEKKICDRTAFAVQLAVEELFVNIVKYNREPVSSIRIDLETDEKQMTVSIRAAGVEPFDIRHARPYDPALPLESRPAGGIGIHLVKSVMDEVDYRHRNGITTITLKKQLEKHHVQN